MFLKFLKKFSFFISYFFLNLLNGENVNFQHMHFKTIASTQDYFRENIDQLFTYPIKQLVITADEQRKGRGTYNRKWASPKDVNIYATFGLKIPVNRIEEIKKSPHITQVVSLSVVQTLKFFGFNPQIKWVNDVLLNKKKICGILCEDIQMSESGDMVGLIGIGLNINMDKKICDSLDQPVTSMKVAYGKKFNKKKVFKILVDKLEKNLNIWFEYGFAPIALKVHENMAYIGENVRILNEDTNEIDEGKFLKIEKNGKLCLQMENNKIKKISHGKLLRGINVDVDEKGKPLKKIGDEKYHMKKKTKILIYNDKGVTLRSFIQAKKSLKKIFKKTHEIIAVNHDYINNKEWELSTDLFVMPGGFSSPHYQLLKNKGNEKIIKYVASGGKYLGFCSGGYYGASKTIFEKQNPLEVVLDGPLNFFSGEAVGPAYGLGEYKYNSERGMRAALVNFPGSDKKLYVYFNGGCFFRFTNLNRNEKIVVLSRYLDIENEPASVIKCFFGKGIAILTGIHPEFSLKMLDRSFLKKEKEFEKLKKSENLRKEYFLKLMMELQIKNLSNVDDIK